MSIRGIRGAVNISEDQPHKVISYTRELIKEIIKANPTLHPDEIASVIFTTTPDIKSAYPAQGARELGWTDVPLLGCQEIPVPGGLKHCIRILIHWNTDLSQQKINHIYLGQSAELRPDLVSKTAKEKSS